MSTNDILGILSNPNIQVGGTLSEIGEYIQGQLSEEGIKVEGSLSSLGLRGYSAYELAVKNGYIGTEEEWLESLRSKIDTKFENDILYYKYRNIEDEWKELVNLQGYVKDFDYVHTDNNYTNEEKQKVENITEDIEEVNSKISNIESNIDNIELDISDIKLDIETADYDISSLKTSVQNINSNIDNIESDINDISGNIEEILDDVSDINGEIESLDSDVNILESKINNVESNISSINSNIDVIDSNISSINLEIESIDIDISEINGNVSTIRSNVSAIDSDVTNVKTRITNAESDISTISTKTDSISSDLNSISDDVNSLSTDLEEFKGTITQDYATKQFVNYSISTNTSYYISKNGEPFNSFQELQEYSGEITNNDYAFVIETDSSGNVVYVRYKYNSDSKSWAEEYKLNNSSFTSEQWNAISSGITDTLVLSYNSHILNKQNPHEVSYQQLKGTKPTYTAQEVGALPSSTIIPTVPENISEFNNDSGYITAQSLSGYVKDTDLIGYATESYVDNHHDSTKQNVINDLDEIRSGASKGETAVQPESGKGLFSGNYNDLTNKPTIPNPVTDEHINSLIESKISGKQDTLTAGENITIEGNVISADVGEEYDDTELRQMIQEKRNISDSYDKATIDNKFAEKQDVLTAGENITIDGNTISATGGSSYDDTEIRQLISEKQDSIPDLSTIRSGASSGATALQPGQAITDVQVNGESITTDGVADIPMAVPGSATNAKAGLIKPNAAFAFTSDGRLRNLDPDSSKITTRSAGYAVTLSTLDASVKAALCDGKGAAWTDAEQKAARDRTGVTSALASKLNANENIILYDNTLTFGDSDNGAYAMYESSDQEKPVVAVYGTWGDDPVALRNIATPVMNYDAVNKKYVDDIVGTIATRLSSLADYAEEVTQ